MKHVKTARKRKTITTPILHAEITGSGPTLVLLHGFLLSSRYWRDLADQLSDRYRVVAIDLLGFGQSPKPRRSRYDYDAHMRSLDATLEKLDITGPFTLMGHSMGGLLSLRYARTNPHKVSKLLLANMPITLSPKEARREFMGTNSIYRLGLTPITHRAIWPLFRFVVKARLLPPAAIRELSDRTPYLFQHTALSRIRSFRNIIINATVEADFRALEVKTVVISGLSDRLIYLENMRRLMLNTNITSQVIEGAHHLVRTKPELFINLLREPMPVEPTARA